MASILIPLAQSCEELEAVTLIDLFRRAGFNVVAASLDKDVVVASRGTRLLADKELADCEGTLFDLVVLPGGLPGADYLRDDERLIDMLKKHHDAGKYVAAICAAPRALVKAGLLEGRNATSYPGTLDKMEVTGMRYVEEPVVIDGNIVTSRGPGTAMEFALTLIELLAGKQKRLEVENPLLRP